MAMFVFMVQIAKGDVGTKGNSKTSIEQKWKNCVQQRNIEKSI